MERASLLQKREKKIDNSITLVLTYHPALIQVYEILQKAHRHVLKSPRLNSVLPSPPRVAFRNSKTLKDKLVRSKLKEFVYENAGVDVCGHSTCDICQLLEKGNVSESIVTKKKYHINFPFNQYKSNIKLYGEGRRGFKQEKLIEHFFRCSENGTHHNIKFKIIHHCHPNDQKTREDFWIYHLDTLHSKVLNQKRALKY